MAQFLTTTEISASIERIVKEAKSKLVLISPYLRLSQNLFERLEDADRRKVKITVIFGKQELKSDQERLLAELDNLSLHYYENLHAKCYFNENLMVITSMNMHEFSEKTNREMGVLVSREQDRELFQKAVDEAMSILKSPSTVEYVRIASPKKGASTPAKRESARRSSGFCIRCGTRIDYDPDAPYCGKCYRVWSRYKDELYLEEYCHRCGEREDTCMDKPLCYPCYRAVTG